MYRYALFDSLEAMVRMSRTKSPYKLPVRTCLVAIHGDCWLYGD